MEGPEYVDRFLAAKVSPDAFMGVTWAGVGFTILFLVLRIYVRITTFRRVFWDDAFVVLAWIMLLASAVTWHVNRDAFYDTLAVRSGKVWPPPQDFPQKMERCLRTTVAVTILFYSSLWSVKIAFLLFFRRLGQKVNGQKYLWWTVLGVTLAAYVCCVGTPPYKCLVSSFAYIITQCASPPRITYAKNAVYVGMILDVVTDALIIAIPVSLLWKVHISLKQKLALGGIFSLTVFIMIFSVIRVALVTAENMESTWLYLWTTIEQAVAIIVACLASFRALFVKTDRPARLPDDPVDLKNVEDNPSTFIRCGSNSGWHPSYSLDSIQNVMPVDRVHVKNTIRTYVTSANNKSRSLNAPHWA